MSASCWVLTCDPGVDDAVVLAVAAGREDCRVEAVVAGAGNVPADTAWRNAAGIAALVGLVEPVGIGSATATDGSPIHRDGGRHGHDGLAGLSGRLPAVDEPPVDGLPLVRGNVLATGPLTDCARALRAGQRIERVVWMGGSAADVGRFPTDAATESDAASESNPRAVPESDPGAETGAVSKSDPGAETHPDPNASAETHPVLEPNASAETGAVPDPNASGDTHPVPEPDASGESEAGEVAEFNAAADPAAVDTVLGGVADVVVVPIEITRQVTLRSGDLARWSGGTRASAFCADLVAARAGATTVTAGATPATGAADAAGATPATGAADAAGATPATAAPGATDATADTAAAATGTTTATSAPRATAETSAAAAAAAAGIVVHDAVAVIAALEPDLFDWSPRHLAASASGRLVSLPGSPNARLAVGVDATAVRARIVAAVAAVSR